MSFNARFIVLINLICKGRELWLQKVDIIQSLSW